MDFLVALITFSIDFDFEFTDCSKYRSISFLVALNTISMGFLVALNTHSMKSFVALKHDF